MKKESLPDITLTVQIFREGKTFIAHNPELNVSSCANKPEIARSNLRDAVRGFLLSANKKGTLHTILEEAGYQRKGYVWMDPEMVALDRFSLHM